MQTYTETVDRDLDSLLRELETIANLTRGAEETITYMKDTAVAHQKSSDPGNAVILWHLIILTLTLMRSGWAAYWCEIENTVKPAHFFHFRRAFQKVNKYPGWCCSVSEDHNCSRTANIVSYLTKSSIYTLITVSYSTAFGYNAHLLIDFFKINNI